MALEKFSFYKKTAEPVTEPEKVMVQATETLAKMLDLESKVSQISQDLGQFITDSVMAQSLDAIQRQLDPLQQELRASLQNEVARINEALQSLGSKSARLAEFVQEQTEKQNRLIQQTALDLDNKILRLPDQAPAVPDLNYLRTDIQELRTDLASLAQELVQEIQTQKNHQESALLESIIAQDRRLLELQDSLQALVFDPAPIYSDLQQIRESLNADIQLAMDAQVQEISQHLLEQNQKILDKDLQIRQQLSQTMAELKVNLNQKIQTLTQQQETVQDQLDLVQSKNLEFTEKYAHVLDKIEFLQEALDKVNTSTILTEEVMPAPAVSSSDPLMPLDKNFVTFDQLKQHYQLFINRIQQQLSTLGGGGSSTLRELDDIDFISFRDNTVNGWPLVYKSATNKWTSSNVMSDATFTGNVAVQGFLSVAGNIVLADATVDLLTVNSDALFEQNVLVQKNLTVQNNVTVGSLTTNNGVVFATNSGRLNTNSNFTWNGTTLSVNGNFDARYIDVVNGFNLNFATANTIPYLNSSRYLVSTNNLTYNGSNLVLTGNQTVNGILTINNDALIHNSNSYTKIAAGSTEERPSSPSHGMVRYNSSLSTFEGYAANAWGSLGGVKSVDGFTYIIPETSPGASNGELEFYVENTAGTAAFKAGGWDRTELNVYTPLNVYANLIAQTAIIQGNLQVTGNITSLEVQNLSVTDNMIYLNSNSSITNPDLGFAGNYNDGTYAHAGVFRDATDGRWKFFEGYTPEPDTSPYINTGHASFRLATVQASSFVGPVTGNVSDISNHTTTSLTEGSNLYFTNARVRAAVSSGTGVSYNQSTGQFSIGQAVATSSDVSFANITATGTVNVSTSGIKFPTDAFGGSGDAATITLTTAGGEATRMTFTMANDADDKFNFVAPSSTGLLMNGNTVWHAGNDGAGSGLDADLLDGISSASFLRSDASATNSVDLRAPIFYDSDNTAYYVDPSSTGTSGVFAGQLVVGDGIRAATSNFITPYNLFALSDTYDSGTYYGIKYVEGSPDTIQIIGANTIGLSIGMDVGDTTASSSLRAPIFYDSNNTSYYADPASTSRLNAISINSIVGNTTNYSVYNSSNTLLATPTGINYSSAFMHFTGANSIAPYSMYRTGGDWPVPYGIGFSTGGESSGIFQQFASNGSSLGPMVFYTGNDGSGSFSWKRHTWESTTYQGVGSGNLATVLMDLDWNQNLYVYGSARAPVFYDQNNTNYYADPASTSQFNYVVTQNAIDGSGVRFTSPAGAAYTSSAGGLTGAFKIKLPVALNNSSTMLQFGVKIYEYSTGRTYEFRISGYNYNLGNWYNISCTQLNDADRGAFTIRWGYDSTSDCVWIGETNTFWSYPQVFVTDLQTGYSGFTNNWGAGWSISLVTAFDTVEQSRTASLVKTSNNASNWGFADYGTIWYDSNDTGYYLDPNSTSDSALRIRGGALHGPNPTWGSYLLVGGDGRQNYTNNTSTASICSTNGNLHIDAASGYDTYINYYDGGNVYFGSGASSYVAQIASDGTFRSPIFYDYNNTAYYADLSSTGDSIRAAGNIVAYYSDERLKTKLGNITNALKKVNQLNGFYYQANELAQSLGYKSTLEVGVSAQEVELVLPEIVKPAPIDQQYKTLDYSRLVPLLIEAIKELNLKVERLEQGTT